MGSRPSILIVEDDKPIATGLALNLKLEGFATNIAADGVVGLERALTTAPDLILLDIGLPQKDGVTLLRELRAEGHSTPVIVLSARDGEYDKVAALKLGADDYVTKPFALAELVARIGAVLRRSGHRSPSPGFHDFGDVCVDLRTRTTTKGRGKTKVEIKLTHLEFELLAFFLAHPGRVISREELLSSVWGTRATLRTVDNFVAQLRAKLEDNPENPKHLVTIRGSGYRFDTQ